LDFTIMKIGGDQGSTGPRIQVIHVKYGSKGNTV